MCETMQIAVNSVINWSFFLLYRIWPTDVRLMLIHRSAEPLHLHYITIDDRGHHVKLTVLLLRRECDGETRER